MEGEKNPTLFKEPAGVQEVVKKYKMDPGKRHIFYCQSGVRTTNEMFDLYLLGWDFDNLAGDDGSRIERSDHTDNPLETDEGWSTKPLSRGRVV